MDKIKIKKSDFPLACPKKASSFGGHPKIYIPFKEGEKEFNCYYCGTKYILDDS